MLKVSLYRIFEIYKNNYIYASKSNLFDSFFILNKISYANALRSVLSLSFIAYEIKLRKKSSLNNLK